MKTTVTMLALALLFFARLDGGGWGVAAEGDEASLTAAGENEPNVVSTQPLPDEECDRIFDDIFTKQQKITRMQARVITYKQGGGVFNKPSVTWGYAYAEMPDCLLFIDRGEVGKNLPESQAAIILIDGTFLWDIKPGYEDGKMEAERLTVKNAGDRDINIAALLIGADVSTGKQLREHYLLNGALEELAGKGKNYHFWLKTIPGKEKQKRKEEVEIWIRPGEVIPWRIKSLRKTPKAGNPLLDTPASGDRPVEYKVSGSTKEISELQTNLSSPPLPRFSAETFYFGELLRKYPGMRVIDSRGQEIDSGQLKQELEDIYSRLKAHYAAPPQEAAPKANDAPLPEIGPDADGK